MFSLKTLGMAALAALMIAGSTVAMTNFADARGGRGSGGYHGGGYHRGFGGYGAAAVIGADIATGLAVGAYGGYPYYYGGGYEPGYEGYAAAYPYAGGNDAAYAYGPSSAIYTRGYVSPSYYGPICNPRFDRLCQ